MKRIIAITTFLSLVPFQSMAEESDDGNVMEEIVVTSTYRDTKLMDTPVSISAVTEELMKNTGAQNMEGLFTMIPGLNMTGGGTGSKGQNRYTIRGISSQSGDIGYAPVSGTVAVFIDGTPVTSQLGPDNQISGTLFDIDRVEVLKGPH